MSLKELNAKAAPGEWAAGRVPCTATRDPNQPYSPWFTDAGPRAVTVARSTCIHADDMAFIAALVNAYRAGELVEQRPEVVPQRYNIYASEAYGEPFLETDANLGGEWVKWDDIASHYGPGSAVVEPRWREDSVRLVQLVKLWASVYGVQQKDLAVEWKASESTVARFLAGEQMPDGPTTARIIAWLFDRP